MLSLILIVLILSSLSRYRWYRYRGWGMFGGWHHPMGFFFDPWMGGWHRPPMGWHRMYGPWSMHDHHMDGPFFF